MARLQHDQTAISAVLGTILMVAVLIALSGAVWLFVHIIQEESNVGERHAIVAFSTDATDSSLQVVRTDPDLDWFRDVKIGGTCDPTLNGGPFPTAEGAAVSPGDVLDCDTGESIRVVVTTGERESVVFDDSFR